MGGWEWEGGGGGGVVEGKGRHMTVVHQSARNRMADFYI